MSETYKLSIDDRVVKTTVISSAPVLDQCLKDLLSTITRKSALKRVVGLGIEKSFRVIDNIEGFKVKERVAVLKLCHGTTCLIIQLHLMSSPPCSLPGFLELPELTFVGAGIRHCLEDLERHHGIKCSNAVDLGQLAATIEKNNILRNYGLLDLAEKVCLASSDDDKWPLSSFSDGALSDWGATVLSKQQVEAATRTSFLCFYVGNHLLGGYLPPSSSSYDQSYWGSD